MSKKIVWGPRCLCIFDGFLRIMRPTAAQNASRRKAQHKGLQRGLLLNEADAVVTPASEGL
jgi:hypothetical protein